MAEKPARLPMLQFKKNRKRTARCNKCRQVHTLFSFQTRAGGWTQTKLCLACFSKNRKKVFCGNVKRVITDCPGCGQRTLLRDEERTFCFRCGFSVVKHSKSLIIIKPERAQAAEGVEPRARHRLISPLAVPASPPQEIVKDKDYTEGG